MKAMIVAGSLGAVLVVTAAFADMQREKAIRAIQTQQDSKGFAVVELFTSEGCSSCPPADALVEKIQEDNKNPQIYILAYHVDYWDHQGWKDRFSDREFSNRQRRYAEWLNVRTVYTPQIVVNGASEHIGSDQGPILRAISAGLNQESAQPLMLTAKTEGNQLQVDYEGAGNEKNTELVLALVQKSAASRVKAGENSGRSLSHVQIVRRLLRVPLDKENKKDISMRLPPDFNAEGWELIGFVQHTADGHISNAGRTGFETK
ncbi:DUF1223 domain-containing protein [Chitinophaga sp. 22620]|uniref:DUF1223 domain-containing protein n=1 Tax=Chitinophaga sp. 22620 TaxID=3453952 RepID=UPI003F863DD9